MDVISKVVDETGELIFQGRTPINPQAMFQIAVSRQAIAREKGAKFVQDGIPVFGKTLVEAVQRQALGDEIDRAAVMAAMMAWLHESVFDGVKEDDFANCDLEFVMLPGGAVAYTRIPQVR
jgi:hypothetical protein